MEDFSVQKTQNSVQIGEWNKWQIGVNHCTEESINNYCVAKQRSLFSVFVGRSQSLRCLYITAFSAPLFCFSI